MCTLQSLVDELDGGGHVGRVGTHVIFVGATHQIQQHLFVG